ncbi:MAG TPA: hypothetical protein VF035_08390, partial [Longimicrobiales bacterium]
MIKPNSPTIIPQVSTYEEAFPNSAKVYVDGPHGIRVPMREITLSGGEPPLRVYDTSGPQGMPVRDGLPKLRTEWIRARGDVEEYTGLYSAAASATQDRVRAGVRDAFVEMPDALLPRPLRARSGANVTQMHYARRGEITAEMEYIGL